MNRNQPCWCGSGKKYKQCHWEFDETLERMRLDANQGQVRPKRSLINNEADIAGIRAAAAVNGGALDLMATLIRPGLDTETLDRAAIGYIKSRGGKSADFHYKGYPKNICVAINDVVCHGIPSPNVTLKEGDIINVDITTFLNGYYADASRMFTVGEVSAEARRLIAVTHEIMEMGIAAARPWHFVGDIGYVCGNYANANGYSVVTDLGGHGVGKAFQQEPFVSHQCAANTGMLLVPGMVITVEPMINQGTSKVYTDGRDKWTVRTEDGKLSAQWEKTILITETGAEVLAS